MRVVWPCTTAQFSYGNLEAGVDVGAALELAAFLPLHAVGYLRNCPLETFTFSRLLKRSQWFDDKPRIGKFNETYPIKGTRKVDEQLRRTLTNAPRIVPPHAAGAVEN